MAAEHAIGLHRVPDGLVGGVCAGLAERYDVDVVVPRILAVLITLVTCGIGAIVYAVLWIRLPKRAARSADDPLDVSVAFADADLCGQADMEPGSSTMSLLARAAIAICLAVLFLMIVAMVPPLMPGTQWWQFWPVAFLLGGVFLVIVPIRSAHETAWHMIGTVVTAVSATALPMSLDIVSWYTLPHAFSVLWLLVAAGVFLLVYGIMRSSTGLMAGGVACLVAFCLFALLFLAIPGHIQHMVLITPQGVVEIIAF